RALHPGHPRTGCRRTALRPLDPAEVPSRALSRRPSHFPGLPRLTGMSENPKTRNEPLSPERAPRWVRLMYRYARRRFGEVPEPFTVAAHHPGLLFSSAVHETLLEKTSSRLPANVRELAVYWTDRKIGCSWCVDFGARLARLDGLNIEKLSRIDDYATSDLVDDDERAAIAYADAM